MLLSIVIISWNSEAMLRRCLDSIAPLLQRRDVELVRVDNGSTDASPRIPDKSVIRLDRNYGVAYARNRGIERARGRYILLLDDDTEARPEALLALINYMEAHPQVGIAAPALRNEAGELQPSFKEYPGVTVKARNLLGLGHKGATTLPQAPFEPCYVIGACQMIRRKLFDEVGLLDEAIFYGPEDADLCIRARKAGWRTIYLPHISVMHRWRHITRRNPFSRISMLHIRALLHFYLKHRRL